MNLCYIELYAASFSDDFDAKMNYFSKSNGFHEILDVQALEMTLMQKFLGTLNSASVGDQLDAKMIYFMHIKWFS